MVASYHRSNASVTSSSLLGAIWYSVANEVPKRWVRAVMRRLRKPSVMMISWIVSRISSCRTVNWANRGWGGAGRVRLLVAMAFPLYRHDR